MADVKNNKDQYPSCVCCDRTLFDSTDRANMVNENFRGLVGLCISCFDGAFLCNLCDEINAEDSYTYTDSSRQEYESCQDCFDANVNSCTDCGDWLLYDDLYYIENGDYQVCEDCFNEAYYSCDYCETGHHNDYYCDAAEEYEHSKEIKRYDYNPPSFVVHSSGKGEVFTTQLDGNRSSKTELTMGFELEIDKGRDCNSLASWINKTYPTLLYCKEDGSLGHEGFEIISHPFTYAFYKEQIIRKGLLNELFSECRSYGYRSYDTKTCGQHVHLGIRSFTDIHLYKFQKFYYTNPYLVAFIARRRSESNLQRWANNDEISNQSMIRRTKHKSSAKYQCVHITGGRSAEIRIFRGTLVPKSFYSNLEFSMASYEFTKEVGIKDVHSNVFVRWLSNQDKYPLLKNRMKSF